MTEDELINRIKEINEILKKMKDLQVLFVNIIDLEDKNEEVFGDMGKKYYRIELLAEKRALERTLMNMWELED
jgi:hypothetical protein